MQNLRMGRDGDQNFGLDFFAEVRRVGAKGGVEPMQLEGFADASASLRSGVYALCAKGRVIYVGKSKSMIGRINAHRKAWVAKRKNESWISDVLGIPGLMFDEVHIRPAPLHDLDRLEREMIDKYKPHYNVQLRTQGAIRAPISIVVAGLSLQLNAPYQPLVSRR